MLDLPGHPVIDKHRLVGGCVRLRVAVDGAQLRREVDALPAALWDSGGRVGVHRVATSIFLRGHAPAEGELPIEERAPLAALPAVRRFMQETIPAPAQRCVLARLPPGAGIAAHIDRAPYFAKTLRLHVPIETNENVWMMAAGRYYRMAEGETWALNNVAQHAVWNADAARARTHLICDFLPTPALLALLADGERDLDLPAPAVAAQPAGAPTRTSGVM
jgi:hypothetical protein